MSAGVFRTRMFVPGFAALLCGWLLLAGGPPTAARQRPDRSTPPPVGPPPELNLPPIQKRALSNGLPVWIVEQHEVPLVQVDLVVEAGSGDDPSGRFGVASLAAAMLDEGAGAKSALEIADEIEFLGAVLNTSSSFDASGVRLNVPRARLEDALPVMADVALRPAFPQQELERLRQERLTALLQARDDPASIGPLAFSRVLYGPQHRYGTSALGTEATLKAFTTEDLRAFHATFYVPSNATLVVAGDVTADAVIPLLEKHFGSWRQAGPPARRAPVPAAAQPEGAQIYIVDVPRAEQSVIRIGWVGVSRSTPDYFALQVLNTVLGGSFTSRLNQNLRERNGYTYGASSGFDMRLSAGPFSARANVQTDKTADALREFFNELRAIAKPIPPEELDKAKSFVALGFPSAFETIGDLSSQLEDLIVYDLPDAYYENYVDNIRSVTAEEVRKAAATYIQPDRFAIVVVGDRAAIEPGIRALDLAPVRVMTVEEAMGS